MARASRGWTTPARAPLSTTRRGCGGVGLGARAVRAAGAACPGRADDRVAPARPLLGSVVDGAGVARVDDPVARPAEYDQQGVRRDAARVDGGDREPHAAE